MNPTHLHLLLNHVPTVAFSIGLGLFVIALAGQSGQRDELKRLCMVIFFLTSAVTIATYVSGNDAHQALKDTGSLSEPLVNAHESAALGAFALMQATGFFAWLGLWTSRRIKRWPNWNMAVV